MAILRCGSLQARKADSLPEESTGHETTNREPTNAGRGHVQARTALRRIPSGIVACLFDLDGVLTNTAAVHAAAWKEMFDAFLREHAEESGIAFQPFDIATDYPAYVDGKLRQDGVRSFLQSRGIELPEGSADDPASRNSIHGLGTRKNDLFQTVLEERGVEQFEGSVRFVEEVRKAGLRTAVVSASKNCQAILQSAGIEDLFEVRVDGVVAAEHGLPGKPAPDTFVFAAAKLDVEPAQSAVFEDAIAGVQAGRAGAFGWVVGVDRVGQADALRQHGADIVVRDLSELLEEQ